LVCYIQKYVIILAGIFPLTSPPTKILGGCVPGIPGGVDASDSAPPWEVTPVAFRKDLWHQKTRVLDYRVVLFV